MNKNEIVLFETEDNEIRLEVPVREETVWLSANQMAVLYDRDEKTIRKHINNVFSDGEVTKRQIKQNPSLHCGGFLYYSVIFSCFTLWSMTWREASSDLISSRLIPA